MYVCMHARTHARTHTSTHTPDMCVHVQAFVIECARAMCACVRACVPACVPACLPACLPCLPACAYVNTRGGGDSDTTGPREPTAGDAENERSANDVLCGTRWLGGQDIGLSTERTGVRVDLLPLTSLGSFFHPSFLQITQLLNEYLAINSDWLLLMNYKNEKRSPSNCSVAECFSRF